jgi:hypothetical protein
MLLKLIGKLILHFVLVLRSHLRVLSILGSGRILGQLSSLILIDQKFRLLDMTSRHLLLHHSYLLLIHDLAWRHDHLIHHQLRLLISLVHLLLHHEIVLVLHRFKIVSRSVAYILLLLHIEYLLRSNSRIFKLIQI